MAAAPWRAPVALGRSTLSVSRLGIGSSYGVPCRAILHAFDQGINYLYWGTYRTHAMGEAIRQLAPHHRDQIVVVLQSYSRSAWLMKRLCHRGLRRLGLDHADVLLLGLRNRMPSERIMNAAADLQRAGVVRHLAVSAHHRPTFQHYVADPRFEILQIRYNAVHPGAEQDVFPHLPDTGGPGVTLYTATSWGQLIAPELVPPGEPVPRASDCYRFVLSHPKVHLCMCGPANQAQMDEAIAALDRGPMTEDELAWMRRVGQYIYAHQRSLKTIWRTMRTEVSAVRNVR